MGEITIRCDVLDDESWLLADIYKLLSDKGVDAKISWNAEADPRDATIARLREGLEESEVQVSYQKAAARAFNSMRDSLAADLAALRAAVEEARVELREFVAEGGYEFEARTAPEAFLQQELKDIIARVRAILAPEGP